MDYKLIYDIEPLNIYKLNYTKCTNPTKINLVKKLLDKNPSINKINNFIKYHKDGEIFYILLNMIKFSLLIEWYYETNILKYYWSDIIIYNLINSNQVQMKIEYLNKKPLKEYLIKLNNQFNLNFNFTDRTINKKYDLIINLITKKLNFLLDLPNRINFGEDFVRLIGTVKNEFNSVLTVSVYFEHDIKFKNKTKLKQKGDYYFLNVENITFKIFMYKYNFDYIMAFKENALFTVEKEIYSNAEFYQNMNQNMNQNEINGSELETYETYEIKLKNISEPCGKNIHSLNCCYICKKFYNPNVYIENYENLCIDCGFESHSNLNLSRS